MNAFETLHALLIQAGARVRATCIPATDGAMLDAVLVLPDGEPTGCAVVALHGCAGPYPSRDLRWALALTDAGHTVLMPDSFGSRGLGSQCTNPNSPVTFDGQRRRDAISSATWLTQVPDPPRGGLALIGWSNGGATVMATARAAPDLPPWLFRGFVAFYPGCMAEADDPNWRPVAPVLVLVGSEDEWAPPGPCRRVAGRYPGLMETIVYPDAYHDFDVPNLPVTELSGLAAAPTGTARVGTDPAARRDALRRVPDFVARLRPV